MQILKGVAIISLLGVLGCSGKHIPLGGEATTAADWEGKGVELTFEGITAAVFKPKCLECHGGEQLVGGQRVKVVKAGIDLTDYESLFGGIDPLIFAGDASKGVILAAVKSGFMPEGERPKLSTAEINLLESWIQAGAPLKSSLSEGEEVEPSEPNEVGEPTEPVIIPPSVGIGSILPEPSENPVAPIGEGEIVTFDRVFTEVLEPRCSRCHSGPLAEGFVDVTDLDALKNNFMFSDLLTKGRPLESRLYRVMESGRMPFREPRLSQPELDLVRIWIEQGTDL